MIYFDSAATTLQKPAAVANGVKWAVNNLASPGRGGHDAAMLASETAFACREAAAQLFSVKDPERVVFTSNATHGLNIAIKSIAKPGDRVAISGYEHNSVLRPLKAMGAEVVVAASEPFEPELAVHAFEKRLSSDTKLVVCNQVSNVFGYILPIDRISGLCRERGIPLIVDAAQSAGTIPIHAEELGAAFIAMPGHKGLYGPQGTGLLICGQEPKTLMEGGTGSNSISEKMPDFLPDRLEAGTHNMPGIAGLMAGIGFVRKRGVDNILRHEQALLARTVKGMDRIRGIWRCASEHQFAQSGVLSFLFRGVDCEETARALGERGVAVRAGLHCSPLAHKTAGTLETGTVRVSFSIMNTHREVDKFLNILEDISKKV